ncbi:calmegin isoform X2 [Triplophysa dalaica]|uniref:calmegin isoform X2 n=1 Tax=Triplophysa dalaica TaxID=1582913 RepID=UPI0024DFDC71|nr:calmegin isoform X2 [Triplophysa dalaica]
MHHTHFRLLYSTEVGDFGRSTGALEMLRAPSSGETGEFHLARASRAIDGKQLAMRLPWSWTCLLLLSISIVTWAQEEELEDEEDALVEDVDVDMETDSNENTEADTNVSFQVTYKTPVPTGDVFFAETFDDGSLSSWQLSKTMKEDADEDIAKYDGKWEVEPLKENKVSGDLGLVLKSRAKHHAIAAPLNRPFVFKNMPLIVQYEVNFQDGIDCGGAYIKLLSDSKDLELEQFHDRTPYSIMFGPDKCGEDHKLHFIFRHTNPLNGDIEEKHAKRPDVDLKKFYTDKKTHLYTLVLNPDNSYEVFIDQSSVSKGSLLTDVVPPVNPPKEIDDPKDSKPEDWDERAKIPDPEAVKPDDWDEDAPAKIPDPDAVKPEGWLDDEPEFVSDPTSEKPDDWDEEMDGEWEAPQVPNPVCETAPGCGEWKSPMINNPEYKGKWKAHLIDNPNYQGVWSPRKIANPDYYEDLHPFRMVSFGAVGLELWSMTSDIYFDNFIITSEKEVADRWAADSWGLKKLVASANEPGVLSQLTLAAEERPWLWVVYILTVGLPIGLGVLFCWPKKSNDDYVYKKIDQPKSVQEDVVEEEEEEEEEDEDDDDDEAEDKGKDEDDAKAEDATDAAVDENGDGIEKNLENGGDTEEEDEDEEEEASKPKTMPSEDEMKDADEGTQISKEEPKAVRKRKVRKD